MFIIIIITIIAITIIVITILFFEVPLSSNHKFLGVSGEVGDVKNLPDPGGRCIILYDLKNATTNSSYFCRISSSLLMRSPLLNYQIFVFNYFYYMLHYTAFSYFRQCQSSFAHS